MTGRMRLCFLVIALLAIALFAAWLTWRGLLPGSDKAPVAAKQPAAKEPDVDMKLVLIPAGKFLMGISKKEEAHAGEWPQREVKVEAFYLGAYEVTQRQYRQVMGNNPSNYSATERASRAVEGLDTEEFPVEDVTWYEAQEFCKRLSALTKERQAGRVYRLPTEVEWEYAARAGTTTRFYTGDTITTDQANFDGRVMDDTKPRGFRGFRLGRPAKVGSYPPNPWGLYDMHGNVDEWCQDGCDDCLAPPIRSERSFRGGNFADPAVFGASGRRGSYPPTQRYLKVGFRVACYIPAPYR